MAPLVVVRMGAARVGAAKAGAATEAAGGQPAAMGATGADRVASAGRAGGGLSFCSARSRPAIAATTRVSRLLSVAGGGQASLRTCLLSELQVSAC